MKQSVKIFLGSFHTKDLKTHAYKSRLYVQQYMEIYIDRAPPLLSKSWWAIPLLVTYLQVFYIKSINYLQHN